MVKRFVFTTSIGLFCAIALAGTAPQIWNFDKDAPGSIAKGFTSEAGAWKVMADSTAPSKGNVLAQTAKNSGGAFNLTLVSAANYKDLDMSVKMKAIAGSEDEGGGLVWRARDRNNYYIARYNPLEDNYRVYKVQGGQRTEFQSAAVKGDKNWHMLRVSMTGSHIQCYFDGKRLLDVKDTTFPSAGKIGLWTKSDAQSHFDDFSITTM